MGSLTVDALFRGLRKGAIEPVYYLHGTEDVLKTEAIREIADRVLDPATRDFNLDQPDAQGLDAERLHALLNTPPMLAERRVVVLRRPAQLRRKTKAREALLRYLAAPSPTTVLVLVDGPDDEPADDLAAAATGVALDRLPPERVVRWIGHRAGQLGLTIDPAAAEHLTDALGGELGLIAQELDKLAATAPERAVTRADVEAMIGVRHGETLADLVAAALSRRPADAARLVAPVIAQGGMSGVKVVATLGTALIGTALARALLDAGTPPGRAAGAVFKHILAARPFGIGKWKDAAAQWVAWARGWTAPELAAALRRTLAADRALKESTVSTDVGIVTELVLAWAVPRAEAA